MFSGCVFHLACCPHRFKLDGETSDSSRGFERGDVVSSINLTAAFVVTQILLLFIVLIGLYVLGLGERKRSSLSFLPRRAAYLTTVFAGFSLITIGALVFSDDILGASVTVFGDLRFPSLTREAAFLVVFVLDLAGAALLVLLTGGPRSSAFSAVLFVLPALAIFLREPPGRFLSYTFGAAIAFVVAEAGRPRFGDQENNKEGIAFHVVALACLALSTMVGYATRPAPLQLIQPTHHEDAPAYGGAAN